MYYIHLYQSSGEIQTVFTSESRDEILQLWAQECAADDEYTEFDEQLTLSNEEIVMESYTIPDSQRGN